MRLRIMHAAAAVILIATSSRLIAQADPNHDGVAPGAAAASITELVALAPAADARRAIAIGPAGQVYEPDGTGAWIRRHAGGIAGSVTNATRAGADVIAGATGGPPFRLIDGAWSAVYVGQHASAVVGTGPRAVAAVGRTVFALDHVTPTRLADAPSAVIALAASTKGVVVETDRGLLELSGSAWKAIKGAPHHALALVSERWILVDHGAFDLRSAKTIPWPNGLHVVVAVAVGEDLVAVATRGKTVELVTVRAGKVDHEPVPIDHPSAIIGVVADREGRAVVALHDGRVSIRDHGTWTTATVRAELAADRPGPPPATSN